MSVSLTTELKSKRSILLFPLFVFSSYSSFHPFSFSPFLLFLYSSFLFFPYSSFLIFTLFFFPLFLKDIPNPTIIRRQMATQAPLNSFFSSRSFSGTFWWLFFSFKYGDFGLGATPQLPSWFWVVFWVAEMKKKIIKTCSLKKNFNNSATILS